MAKKKKRAERRSNLVIEASPRDFVMARLAAGRAAAQSAITAIDEALNLFVNPDQDRRGKEREEMIGEALEALGCACRAVEMGELTLDQADLEECEPWDDEGVAVDGDEEDDDNDEDEDEDEDEDDDNDDEDDDEDDDE